MHADAFGNLQLQRRPLSSNFRGGGGGGEACKRKWIRIRCKAKIHHCPPNNIGSECKGKPSCVDSATDMNVRGTEKLKSAILLFIWVTRVVISLTS